MQNAIRLTFDDPVELGTLTNRISMRSVEIVSLSFNLAPPSGKGNMLVSVSLRDPDTGNLSHVVCEDKTVTPAFWSAVSRLICPDCGKPWPQHLLERLIADGKLPKGAIALKEAE
jgi:hypothetical protein